MFDDFHTKFHVFHQEFEINCKSIIPEYMSYVTKNTCLHIFMNV